MMAGRIIHSILTYLIATVWMANGLFCKVLHLVPRHQLIVARILGDEYARLFTITIGVAEVGMAIWILSGIKTRLNSVSQIVVVTAMNMLEFILVPDLLLFGKANAMVALGFILVVYYNESVLNKKLAQQT